MAPKGVSTWRRPHTSIYNDNYKYGTNLYSGTLSDIQKKYTDSMSKTQLRSDRPDLNLSTFTSSNIGSSSTPAGLESTVVASSPLPGRDVSSSYRGSVFESMLNSALHSSYVASDVIEDKMEEKKSVATPSLNRSISEHLQPSNNRSNAITELPRPTSLYDDAGLFVTPKRTAMSTSAASETKTAMTAAAETTEVKDDVLRLKKRMVIREIPSPVPTPSPNHQQDNPSPVYWKDKCRDLQFQVDELTQAMADMSSKLKGELTSLKSKLHTEMTDMHSSLEHTSHQNNELQKTIKKQANQLMEMQNSYEDLQRHLQDSLDEIGGYQRRSQTLRKEMDRLRLEVEETIERSRA